MTIGERSRHDLFLKLEEVLGPEEAATLMEHLPPVGWADVVTKRDLDQLAAITKRDLDQLAEANRLEHERLEELIRSGLAEQDRTFRQEHAELEQRLIANLRGKLLGQTRTMIFVLVSTFFAFSGVVFAARLV
jgi:hypothetical protein